MITDEPERVTIEPMIIEFGQFSKETEFRTPHPWQQWILTAAIVADLPCRDVYLSQLQNYKTRIINRNGTFEISVLSGRAASQRSSLPIASAVVPVNSPVIRALPFEILVFGGRDGFLTEVDVLVMLEEQIPFAIELEQLKFIVGGGPLVFP
jgi:hypothetical protein